jgi:hypothetical protein
MEADIALITATAYGLDDLEAGVRVPVDSTFSSASFLYNGYLGLFLRGESEVAGT